MNPAVRLRPAGHEDRELLIRLYESTREDLAKVPLDGGAKQVLLIFCSGALSHVDTWDYKPELIKRHDQPLPGDKLVTFQGENGNLVRPHWEFKARGECGKMISDMLPNLAGLADDLCFIHSLTSKTNTHGPGENYMSTGFTLDGFPSMGA